MIILTNNNYISYNKILKFLNILLFITTFTFYIFHEKPIYINNYTFIIYSLLSIQVFYFLKYENKYSNPFILLLIFILIVYTYPRIITFYWYNDDLPNLTLNRIIKTTSFDVNYTLIFILIANLFIFLGLTLGKSTSKKISNRKEIVLQKYKITKAKSIFLFFLIFQLLTYPINEIIRNNSFFSLFTFLIDSNRILPFIILYILIIFKFKKIEFKKYLLKFIIFIILWALLNYISGNRSAFINLLQIFFIISLLLCFNKIKKKYFSIIFLILLFSIPFYIIGTFSRDLKLINDQKVSINEVFVLVSNKLPEYFNDNNFISLLNPIFNRVAYLDYSIDLIKNADQYHKVVNLQHYFMSIIDAITPGFDIFNVPKSANSLIGIYGNGNLFTKNDIINDYQSDQFNVYGEFYVAYFKWFSIIPIFLFSFLFTYIFYRLDDGNTTHLLWKSFILFKYFNWLISFGTDWLIIYIIYDFITYSIFIFIIEKKFINKVYV